MPVSGDQFPSGVEGEDTILTGINVIACPTDPQMVVLVKIGTYRINGNDLTRGAIKQSEGAEFAMSMGGIVGEISGAIAIDAAPAIGTFRIDLIVIGTNTTIDYIKGSDFTTTAVVPDLPADHAECGRVLIYGDMTEVTTGDINRSFTTPTASEITMTIADDDLGWSEPTTAVTLSVFDQYGNSIKSAGIGWYLTLEIASGNGEVYSAEEGSSPTKIGQHIGDATHEYAFTYTRGLNDPGDVSPSLKGEVITPYTYNCWGYITLRDVAGDPMT